MSFEYEYGICAAFWRETRGNAHYYYRVIARYRNVTLVIGAVKMARDTVGGALATKSALRSVDPSDPPEQQPFEEITWEDLSWSQVNRALRGLKPGADYGRF